MELDKLLAGGLPRHSMVLLAGGPGVGKTILSAKYIYEGATKYEEPGVYVCFAETSNVLVNSLLKFGWDFEALKLENRVSILDLSIGSEIDVQSAINQILDAITSLRARRLVIDSITAMCIGLKSEVEKRHVLHLLYKLIQKSGCTALVIMEMPWGTRSMGNYGEAFIADGIILMESCYDNEGVLRRQLRILKMRGTGHSHKTHEYTIGKNGISIGVKLLGVEDEAS